MSDTIPILEAAKRMGVGEQTIRFAPRKKVFPVGWAVECEGGKWGYCIPREAFENYMKYGRYPPPINGSIAGNSHTGENATTLL